MPPLDSDPVIEAYKKGVDRTLIRENLKLTPEQRIGRRSSSDGPRFSPTHVRHRHRLLTEVRQYQKDR